MSAVLVYNNVEAVICVREIFLIESIVLMQLSLLEEVTKYIFSTILKIITGIHYSHTLLVLGWQVSRTVLYILTRLEANGASPPTTQENKKAPRLGTTSAHTCMSSVKSLNEQPAIMSAYCQH